jgi:hypothetical protein
MMLLGVENWLQAQPSMLPARTWSAATVPRVPADMASQRVVSNGKGKTVRGGLAGRENVELRRAITAPDVGNFPRVHP